MIKLWRDLWNKTLFRFLFVSFVLLSIAPAVCLLTSLFDQRFAPLSQVEDFIGIKVPQSATNIQYRYSVWQGVSIRLRFSLPANNVAAYIDELMRGKWCSHSAPENNYTPFGTFSDTDWFKPSLTLSFAGLRCVSGAIDYEFLIDKTNPTLYTIYLSAGAA